jgi:methyl-accepting chemotaxis protein
MLTTFNQFSDRFQDRFNSLSFKTKATLMAVALGVLPVAAIGILNYLQISNANEQQTTKTQSERATLIADKLNRFMFERNGDVETLASLPIFTDPKVMAIASPQSKAQLLDRFVVSYRVYDSIAAFDLNGNPIVQSQGERLGNHLDRAYFQAALKTGKTVISSPEISKTTSKYVIHFATPIKDLASDRIIGIMQTRVPIDRFDSTLKDFATKTQDYHILDRLTGKVFISSNGQYTGKAEDAALTRARTSKELVRHQNEADKATLAQGNLNADMNKNNHAELISAAPFEKIEGISELPWTAFSVIDEDAANAELQVLLLTTLVEVGLTASLTVGVSLLLGNRVTKFIKQLADSIVTSSGAIVDTVEMQEVTVNMQANSAIDTSSTVNELGAISFQSAAQAEAAANGARQALSLSEDGTRAVQQTLQGMNGLREKVDAIANQIVNLSEQTGQITIVSDLVADLASQTNMLALNAAVEAARAGEQGKGFSVVADEIRKLADQSKKSADKINSLAEDIQSAINRTVMVTDEGTKTVNEGIDLARSTAATFAGVTDAVNNVFLNSQQISTSAKQQAVSIQQVLTSMTTISQGSQESAVGMHQVKMTTRELTQVADELKAAVV